MGVLTNIKASMDIVEKLGSFKGWLKKRKWEKIYRQAGYHLVETNKKVFIKKNGNGVAIFSFDFVVTDAQRLPDFERHHDFSDSKTSSEIPSFDQMKAIKSKVPFVDYMFWYQADDDIISRVTESNRVNKSITLHFEINRGNIVTNKQYRVVYGFSIPGLYPIKDGYYDSSENPSNSEKMKSSRQVIDPCEELHYAVYFDNNIKLKDTPVYIVQEAGTRRSPEPCIKRNNLFYTKYRVDLTHPDRYNDITIRWSVKGP